MVMKLYTIRDNIAEEFGPVFVAKNDNVAKRQFIDLIQENQINITDYTLWYVGDFYPETDVENICNIISNKELPHSVIIEVKDIDNTSEKKDTVQE